MGDARFYLEMFDTDDNAFYPVTQERFYRVDDERVLNMADASSLEPIEATDEPQ